MASRNVVREDVVQVTWDVEESPFGGISRTVQQMSDEVGGTIRETTRLSRSADGAGDSLRDMANEGRRMNPRGIRDTNEEVDETRQNTRQAREEMRNLARTRMSELADSIRESSSELLNLNEAADQAASKISGGLATALGAVGVGAGAGAAVSFADDYKSALNSIQAATGANDTQMKRYAEDIESLYKDAMGESLDDIAASMSKVNQITGSMGDELRDTTYNALLMRDTFEWDVGESVRSVDMMMKQFGISSDEAYNLLAQGAQNGLDKNDNLLDSVNEYSVHFKQLGFDADEMFNVFANGAESGVFDIDKLGDAMKEFGIRSKDGSDTTADAFAAIGADAATMASMFTAGGAKAREAFDRTIYGLKEIKDPVERNAVGVALFGTMWEDMGEEAIFAMADVKGSIKGGTDALEAINDVKYDSLGSALTAIGRSIQTDIVLPIVNDAMPTIKNAIEQAKGFIEDFKSGLLGTAGDTESAFWKIGAVVGAIGNIIGNVASFAVQNLDTILPAIAGLVAAFTVYKTLMMAITIAQKVKMAIDVAMAAKEYIVTAAQWAMNSAMLASPITWIIVGMMAIIGVLIYLSGGLDGFVENWKLGWQMIKDGFSQFIEWLKIGWQMIVDGFNTFVEWWKMGWQMIKDGVSAFIGWLQTGWQMIIDGFNTFKEWWINGWNAIKTFVVNLATAIVTFFQNNWQALLMLIVNPLAGAFMLVYNNCETFRNFVNNVFTAIKNFITNIFTSVKDWVVNAWTSMVSIVTGVVSSFVTSVQTAFTNIANAVKNGVTTAKNNITSTFENIFSFFSELPSKFLSFGRDIINGLVNGIKEKISAVKDTIVGIGEDVTGWFKGVMGIASPSKVTAEMGMFVTQGLEVGMTDELKNLKNTASMVGNAATSSVQNGTGIQSAYGRITPATAQATGNTTNTTTEYNTYSPSFKCEINGAGMSDRELERKFKAWFKEAIEDYIDGADRRNPRLSEV